MIRKLFGSSTSACFELVNESPYYAPARYRIFLDDTQVREGDSNVFSLFGLKPGTQYKLRLSLNGLEEMLVFRTEEEQFSVDVREFGAAGDGVTDDTRALQTAIHFLPVGGRLHFPAGRYLTSPLALKSHMTLEFSEGAVLLGSTDRRDYPVIPATVKNAATGEDVIFGAFEGLAEPMYQALITAQYAEDITIVGPGTVDGNAQNSDFWTAFREDPVARPRLCFFNHCKNVYIHGITGCNSPSWHFHPFFCKNVAFYDMLIRAPKDSPNTDAIDPESCDTVRIVGCRFCVGDDCIAIKSGKIELGAKYKTPADHHTIRNCLMEFGHGAVTLGSEIGAGIRNLTVEQCYFRRTDRGLRIKTRRGRGKDCDVDGVVFHNIRMEGVLTPIVMNMWYNCCDPDRFSEYVWSREKLPVDERTPHLGSFTFQNLVCTGAEVAACYIDGLPEMPIDEVKFENVSVDFAPDAKPGIPAMQNQAEERCRLGLYLENVRKVSINKVTVNGAAGDRIITKHCDSLNVQNMKEV